MVKLSNVIKEAKSFLEDASKVKVANVVVGRQYLAKDSSEPNGEKELVTIISKKKDSSGDFNITVKTDGGKPDTWYLEKDDDVFYQAPKKEAQHIDLAYMAKAIKDAARKESTSLEDLAAELVAHSGISKGAKKYNMLIDAVAEHLHHSSMDDDRSAWLRGTTAQILAREVMRLIYEFNTDFK